MTSPTQGINDIAIIGAGPAGLSAALYAARGGLRTVIFGDPYDSQLAKAGIVENFLTWREEGTQGLQITEAMLLHALDYGAILVEDEVRRIRRIKKDEKDVFEIADSKGETYLAYAVILCTGTRYKKLGVPGEEEYYAKGVGYCTVCEGPLFQGKPVAVVGFGEEAGSAALRMVPLASRLELIITRPNYGGIEPSIIEQLKNAGNVNLYDNARPLEIIGGPDGNVAKFRFKTGNEEKTVDVDAVFIEVGTLPSSAIAAEIGVELDGQFVKVDREQKTNVPGFFAAGDITGGIARQAIISAGDGARAAIQAIDYIKKHGLSDTKLKTTQWGSVKKSKAASKAEAQKAEKRPVIVAGKKGNGDVATTLYEYVMADEGFATRYQQYQPLEDLIVATREKLPKARVICITAHWCADCRRNVPKLCKISKGLPEWEFIIEDRDQPGVAEKYNVRKIPTFIIQDLQGNELGRIIESPKFGTLELDLFKIASGEYNQEPHKTAIHEVVKTMKEFSARYERYQPDLPLIQQISEKMPTGKVLAIVCRDNRECHRYIPRLARVMENLPQWDVEVHEHATLEITEKYNIRGLPTFIFFTKDGKEIGRITGKPSQGSVEKDLLNMVQTISISN